MDILTKIKGLSYIGWRNILASLRYSVELTALERRARRGRPEPAAGAAPGVLVALDAETSGARCRFADVEMEVRFLAPDLVRITWQPGELPIPYALAKTEWPENPVTARQTDEGSILATGEVELLLRVDGSLSFRLPDGSTLKEDLPPYHLGGPWVSRARTGHQEHFFGLGERTAPLDLKGGRFRFWNREPKGQYGPHDDPLYLGIPVYVGLHAQGSYLVFFENPFDGTISFGDEVRTEFQGGALRYYVAVGPLPRLMERFTELTGRPALPPRWALGFHQSRWSYRDEREVREVVQGFQQHRLPLSAIHLDIHHMEGYRVFTIDADRFPDLPALSRELAADGVHTVVILDPGVMQDPGYEVYQDGMTRDAFVKLPDGTPVVAPVWPGNCVFPDFTDPQVRSWWGEQYEFLLDQGAHGIWHDMNEPAAFTAWGPTTLPTTTRHRLEGRGGDHLEAHNLYGLLECRAGFEGLERLRPERRPWILSRSGWAGLQRYAWTWTGDCETNWWSMRQSLRIALGLGLSGIPYSGPDIGGFSGNPDRELFVRWFQLAAFLPFFRVHCAGFTHRREPWRYGPQVLDICRESLELRYRLLPYLYTLAYQASQNGHPLVRPLAWEEPTNPEYWTVEDSFLLGPALLVAPAFEKGMRHRQVLLPKGDWYRYWDDQLYGGPGPHGCNLPLERIGLFVRAGTLLPLETERRLVLHLYMPAGQDDPMGQEEREVGLCYSDSGDGYGPARLDRFLLHRRGKTWMLSRTVEGQFELPHLGQDVVVHGATLARAEVDGTARPIERNRFEAGDFREVLLELDRADGAENG